jgi:L-ornithine N5-oxygenase
MPFRFLVVGAGQSAAEVFQFLAREFPAATVTLAHRNFALMPANSSALVNEIFNPETVDLVYGLATRRRGELLADLRRTNYAAVDSDDIRAVADLLYDERVHGGNRLRLRRFTELAGCRSADGPACALRDLSSGQVTEERFDAVVLATGYDFTDACGLLDGLQAYVLQDEEGGVRVGRDYAVQTRPEFRPQVYLHGAAEHTHGLSSTLLSLIAHRGGEILDAVFRPTGDRRTTMSLPSEGALA